MSGLSRRLTAGGGQPGSATSLKSRADGDGFDLLLLLSALGPVSVKWLELLRHLNLTLQTGSS